MSFDTQVRTFAIAADVLSPTNVANLIAAYSDEASDGDASYHTLCCGWDTEDHTRLRAVKFGSTFSPVPLNDGRFAVSGLWSIALLAALPSLPFSFAELSPDQFFSLRQLPAHE